MRPEAFKDLLDKYLRGECSEEEKRYVESWYNNIPLTEDVTPAALEDKLWSNITKKTNVGVTSRRFVMLKAAAVVALLISISAVLYLSFESANFASVTADNDPVLNPAEVVNFTSVVNDTQLPRQVAMEDGSAVTLQPGSRLSFPRKFNSSERIVTLTGEAFFDIRRDTLRPFYVYAKEVVTKVLGTSFNIKALDTDKKITVAVRTGKVKVYTNPTVAPRASRSSVILTPNQQAVYSSEDVAVSRELVEKPELILEKPTLFEMQYDGAPVAQIFKVIEENYGVDIQFDSTAFESCVLTTKMSKEGLFERINIICKAIGASYSIEDAVIKIEGSGCN